MFSFCEKGAYRSLLPLRVVTGIIFLAHGAPKVANLQGTIEGFAGMGISAPVTILVAVIEALGGLALILGAMTRLAALGEIIVMIGAVVTVHGANGFFLKNQGYEYNLALIAMCLVLFMAGSGPLSIDEIFARLKASKLQRHSFDERPKG